MHLYFGHTNTSGTNTTVSKAVADRGLDFIKAKPCDIKPIILIAHAQPGYGAYIRHLPAYMHATQSGRTETIRVGTYPIRAPAQMLPLKLPNLIYNFKAKPTDAIQAQLQTHSTYVVKGQSQNSYVMRAPTVDNIKNLVRSYAVESDTRHIVNTINIKSTKALIIIQKVVSSFILTHRYPAYRHVEDENVCEIPTRSHVAKKRKLSCTDLECRYDAQKYVEGHDNDTVYKKPDSDPPTTVVTLTQAKPSTPVVHPWGTIDEMPNSSGIFVPYVHDLAIADNKTVPSLMIDYFARALAPSLDNIAVSVDELSSAWGTICYTDTGHELTHLCKCIEIALKAQCIVYPVYSNNIYEGTAILGTGYSMYVKGQMYEALSYANLLTEVRSGSLHTKSIREICAAVNDNAKTDDIVDASTMRQLSAVLRSIKLDDVQRNTIVGAAHNLAYSNNYWSTSAINVTKMLELIVDDTVQLGDDIPMHPTYLFATERIDVVMAAFGHSGPSFQLSNAATFDVKISKPPTTFGIRTVALKSAISDMKYTIEQGKITNNRTNLSKRHGESTLNGSVKTQVWDALKTLCQAQAGNTEANNDAGNVAAGQSLFDEW